ncbi:hypothetical protein GUJ93_ZPchr0010g7717 [Zizania palustris]|uniref:Response regulatory domain-containing protein n=1 Tax=Zizania palustris TaxID=103762 RepID=A0A8J5WEZ6_ZIZPA|nr:hypothetical protein GUJ93_ZPchr0010g7717 [Zizania palustris]
MDEQMFSFFPDGIRAVLVDDDTKFVKYASVLLSLVSFEVVATCPNPNAGLRILSGDNLKDVHVVLCDAHKVVASGFDFRDVVETELRIPVIYFLSPMQQAAGDEVEFLHRIMKTATYIIQKPLDAGELCELWRVVAWRKRCLEVSTVSVVDAGIAMTAAPGGDAAAAASGSGAGSSMLQACAGSLPLLPAGAAGGDDGVVVVDEERVHFKAVRSGGGRKRQLGGNDDDYRGAGSSEPPKQRVMWTPRLEHKFESAVKHVGIDAHPNEILEHMNVKGLERQHVASHLQPSPPQKYRAKQQKKDLEERLVLQYDSIFLRAIFPSLNLPAYDYLTLAGAAGRRNVITVAAFTGSEVGAAGAPQLWRQAAPVYPQPQGQQLPAAEGNVVVPVDNYEPVAAVQALAVGVGQQQRRRQHLSSGGSQLLPPLPVVPQLFFGPFSYQGPLPPSMQNHLNFQAAPVFPAQAVMEQPEPELPLPFEQPVGDLVGASAGGASIGGAPDHAAAASYAGALQHNGAANTFMSMDAVYSPIDPIVATHAQQGAVAVASEEYSATVTSTAILMEAASNNAGQFMLPQVVPAAETEIAAYGEDDDFTFPLEALLGLEDNPFMDVGAGDDDAAEAQLNADDGGMETPWWDLIPESDFTMDELLMNNHGPEAPDDFIPTPNDVDGIE